MPKSLIHPLLGQIRLPWEKGLSLLCSAAYGGNGSKYHCDEWNSYYALDFDRPWEGNIEPETDILAVADGVVAFAGDDPNGLFGLCVKINHNHNVVSIYAHLKEIKNIYAGQQIKQGQILGLLGETGQADGPHLHFQLFVNDKCLRGTTEARPEPISGYCNLEPGQWYESDNYLKGKE